jgi:hypothetical protein
VDDAFGLARQVSGSDDEGSTYVNWLRERTRNLMRHQLFWPLVDALAEAFVEPPTLSGVEIRVVFAEARERTLDRRHDRSVFGAE